MSKYVINSLADLKQVHAVAIQQAERHKTISTRTQVNIEGLQARLKDQLDRLPPSVRTDQVERALQVEFSEGRVKLVRQTANDRVEAMRELNAAKEAAVIARQESTPKKILQVAGLGTPERAAAFAEMSALASGSNYAALQTVARNLMKQGPKAKSMAGALLTVLDSIPTEKRASVVDSIEFANAIAGEESKMITATCNEIETAFEQALARDRSIESGNPINPTAKIAAALREGARDTLSDAQRKELNSAEVAA